jgi:hypothetical protein
MSDDKAQFSSKNGESGVRREQKVELEEDRPSASLADREQAQFELERERLSVEREKARLDYRKFVLGSVFVAIAIAAIPPLFQLATAFLEYVKTEQQLRLDQQNKEADRQTEEEKFREEYVKDFLTNALNQDVELRIRFAEYFSYVSADTFRKGWTEYRDSLLKHRDQIRKQIDEMEADWQLAQSRENQRGSPEVERLERNLAWAYKEVGYVEHDRSVAANPRAPYTRALVADLLKDPAACESFRTRNFKGKGALAADADYLKFATELNIDAGVLRAIAQVISGGHGFIEGRPVITFRGVGYGEPNVLERDTNPAPEQQEKTL